MRLAFLMGFVLLVGSGLAGCTTVLWSTPQEEPHQDTIHFSAEGEIIVAGLTDGTSFLQAEGEVLSIHIGSASPRLDSAGNVVETINITYEFRGNSVSHWVHPGSGRIVTTSTEAAAVGQDFGTRWSWTAEGLPGLLGFWEQIAENETVPETITRTAPPRDDAFPPIPHAEMTLKPMENSREARVQLPATSQQQGWEPPALRETDRIPWDAHVPRTDPGDMPIRLEDAIENATQLDTPTSDYVSEHPQWQLTYTSYTQNPGPAPLLTTNHVWDYSLDSPNSSALGRQATATQGRDRAAVYQFEAGGVLPGWQTPDALDLIPYANGWTTLTTIVQPNETGGLILTQSRTHEGPLIRAIVHFDPYQAPPNASIDTYYQGIGLNLETGLLSFYTGPEDPQDVIETDIPPTLPDEPQNDPWSEEPSADELTSAPINPRELSPSPSR